DIIVSSAMLLIALPLMAVIAILVKLDSEGPVFYRQTRVGLNRRKSTRLYDPSISNELGIKLTRRGTLLGKPFEILKFRSMQVNAEVNGRAQWCKQNDSRITRIGKLLRKTHLDELPQLINIL